MQYRTHDSSPASFNIVSGEKVSPSLFADHIRSMATLDNISMPRPVVSDPAWKYLNFDPEINLKKGIAQLLAWHLNNRHIPPGSINLVDNHDNKSYSENSDHGANAQNFKTFSTESGYQLLQRQEVPSCKNDDTYCLRGHRIFPCASECSDSSKCQSTGFDEALLTSQKLTKDCSKVMYLSILEPDVETINISAPYSSGDKSFCKIAFVSMKTQLVIDNPDMSVYKGWNLIKVDFGGENSPSQDEKWLPKLSPGKLFHPQVRYAIYVDHKKLQKSPRLDDMLFIISLMNMQKKDVLGNTINSQDAMMLFSALEPKAIDTSKNKDDVGAPSNTAMTLSDVREMILAFRRSNEPKDKRALQQRINLSQQAVLLLNRCGEFSTTFCQNTLKYKLRHWVKTKWVVHDLHSSDAKDLRCDWYKEHIKLDDNYDEYSFAHTMAIREIERFLSLDDDTSKVSVDEADDKRLTKAQILESFAKNEIEDWISLGNERNQRNDRQSYVRIVGLQKLAEARNRWEKERTKK